MHVCGKQAHEAASQLNWYALLHVLHTASALFVASAIAVDFRHTLQSTDSS